MQRLGGLLLIVSGLSLGTYTFLPPAHDGEHLLREITRISAAPDRVQVLAHGRSAWIEPADTASVSAVDVRPAVKEAATPPAVAAPAVAPDANARPFGGWTAVVTASPDQKHMTSSQPGDEATRSQLTRDLQQALHSVGCYTGEINGAWTPSTKRAMTSFLDRVNATLPVHEPDYILLTMVQSHRGPICGGACPSGQNWGSDGRCVPDGVLAARAAKSSKRVVALKAEPDPTVRRPVESAARAQPAPAPTRTAALRESEQPARASAVDLPVRDERDIAGARAGDEQLPWLAQDDLSVAAPVPVPAPRRVRRPDGMMAIGASQIARAEIEDLPSVTGEPRRVKPSRKRAAVVLYEDADAPAKALAPAVKAKPSTAAKRKAAAVRKPPVAAAKPQKYIYYAGGRRGAPRPGSPAFNMLQAMGGIY